MGILEIIQNIDAIEAIIVGVIGIAITAIISGIVFLLKRYFTKSDFEQQQNLQHSLWLMKKNHTIASEHYVPIAKYAYEAMFTIKDASKSKTEQDIQSAYYYLFIFLGKYVQLEMISGANFLFMTGFKEEEAVKKIHAIMVMLPFTRTDINKIATEFNTLNGNFNNIDFKSELFIFFKQWVTSNNCERSIRIIREKLNELQKLLDNESEKLLQAEKFLSDRKIKKSNSNRKQHFLNYEQKYLKKLNQTKNQINFHIIHLSPKHVKREEFVFVFGSGFTQNNYRFNLNDIPILVSVLDDTLITFRIPASINPGTYDLYATFTEDEQDLETIGLVLHILDHDLPDLYDDDNEDSPTPPNPPDDDD